MKKVTVREFQLHASEYLKELPIVLTVYGKPVASVVPFAKSVNRLTPKPKKSVNTPENVLTEKPGATFSPAPKPEFKGKKARIGYDKKKKEKK